MSGLDRGRGAAAVKPKRVLVVDDEEHICELVKTYFSQDFDVTLVYDGKMALEKFKMNPYDLVILDIMLPGMSGWDVCRQIRQQGETPIIMLTAKDDDIDKILGLELGADDYVTKPFNPRELLARAKAVLRRFTGDKDEHLEILEYPGIVINKTTHKAILCGQNVELTAKEFDLLWLLASNPEMVFSREQIIQKIWGYDYVGETRAIDNAVKRLRRKLEAVEGALFYIHTVWGVGYKFKVEV